jgi:superfamily II DNA or RNA helicase
VRAAYLLASSRSERQFIQRRGRILRKAKGKEIAHVKDYLVLPPRGETSVSAQNLVRDELVRAFEFAKFSVNSVVARRRITTLAEGLALDMTEVSTGTSVREDYM